MSETLNKGVFKTLQIIYSAFMFGIIVFLLVVLYQVNKLYFLINMDDIFTIIVPLMTLSGIVVSFILNNNFKKMLLPEDTLQVKLTKFQSASIIKGALLEGPALIAIVATFVSGNYFFLLFSIVLLLVMYLQFPSKQKFAQLAQLSFEEKSKLDTL